MANQSLADFDTDDNSYISEKPFSDEERSSWIAYSSKSALFRAIFAAFFFTLKNIPAYIIDTVTKMLQCGTGKLGFTMYQCPSCGQYKKVPFTCKTRLCCSCGNLYNMQRANAIAEKMFNVNHRHAVFTIPDTLRPYFQNDRELLDLLFSTAYDTIYDVIHSVCPKLDVTPGAIAVCHTFSRSSRWNPHIHYDKQTIM